MLQSGPVSPKSCKPRDRLEGPSGLSLGVPTGVGASMGLIVRRVYFSLNLVCSRMNLVNRKDWRYLIFIGCGMGELLLCPWLVGKVQNALE